MNAPPNKKPTVTTAYTGRDVSHSMAGRSREKKLAAIMIPAAPPIIAVRNFSSTLLEKNTRLAPSAVIA